MSYDIGRRAHIKIKLLHLFNYVLTIYFQTEESHPLNWRPDIIKKRKYWVPLPSYSIGRMHASTPSFGMSHHSFLLYFYGIFLQDWHCFEHCQNYERCIMFRQTCRNNKILSIVKLLHINFFSYFCFRFFTV